MKLGLLGGGAWGTALAKALAPNFSNVIINAMEDDVVLSINNAHENLRYLPNIKLPTNISATTNINEIAKCDFILITTPAQYIRSVLVNLKNINPNTYILICAKGLEISSGKLISQVVEDVLGKQEKLGVFSGPSFAKDLAHGLPTTMVVAMPNLEDAKKLAEILKTQEIRNYYSNDVIGTQVGGAIKNVIAIGAGIVSGASLGHNALAGLITRGLQELLVFSNFFGGKENSIFGLSGLGDLVLTCTSESSRNFSLGQQIGQLGYYDKHLENNLKGVSEGFYTAKAIYEIIAKNNLDMPICRGIYNICYEGKTLKDTMNTMMSRSLKQEF